MDSGVIRAARSQDLPAQFGPDAVPHTPVANPGLEAGPVFDQRVAAARFPG